MVRNHPVTHELKNEDEDSSVESKYSSFVLESLHLALSWSDQHIKILTSTAEPESAQNIDLFTTALNIVSDTGTHQLITIIVGES